MSRIGLSSLVLLLVFASACARTPATGVARCPDPPDPSVLAALPEAPALAGDATRGDALFQRDCARCHSPRIEARESRLFRGYPRLDCDAYLAAAPDAYLQLAIANGGPAVNRDKLMKPFAEALSPQEIVDLIAGLRAGTSAPPNPR